MNEHQLAIGETTFDGRPELENKQGGLHYWILMQLALQRARTAREAIKVMADLVDQYGYASTGESFSIADPNEAWILEMIGPGDGGKGAIWVAVKVPDGMISAHANKSRIGTFPLADPQNCIYSSNVIEFAVQKGVLQPQDGRPVPFLRRLLPGDGADAALHGDPRLVYLQEGGAVARAAAGLQSRQGGRQAPTHSGSNPTASSQYRT
jgi:dipeptidase